MTTTSPASSEPLSVAVIVGSTREGRHGHVVAEWFATHAASRSDVAVEVVDLADFDLPDRYTFERDEPLLALLAALGRNDAFVVVTPEYNHSYPASLKHAIDFAKDEWRRKVVGFVSYGGVSGGLRAVEHLRQVFAELHVHTLRDSVSFHGPWNGFDTDGRPGDPAGAEAAATILLDELVWWGSALRAAR